MESHLVGNVHLVAGDTGAVPLVHVLLAKEGIEWRGNPDVYMREFNSFGVDDARELAARASSRAVGSSGSRRVFIVVATGMTNEAQNALLKTLEEPPGDALFFFVVPAPETLLATLRSRAQILVLGGKDDAGAVDPVTFLKAASAKRIEMLKPLLEKGSDDRRNLGTAIMFLSSLERILAESKPLNSSGLEAIYRARKYVNDKGALIKPLLEQVALLA
jgi:DNA polymerase III delta prime subunit